MADLCLEKFLQSEGQGVERREGGRGGKGGGDEEVRGYGKERGRGGEGERGHSMGITSIVMLHVPTRTIMLTKIC